MGIEKRAVLTIIEKNKETRKAKKRSVVIIQKEHDRSNKNR